MSKAIKNLKYNVKEQHFTYNIIINEKDRSELIEKCVEFELDWNEFEHSINETLSSLKLLDSTSMINENIDADDLELGSHIRVTHKSGFGKNKEELLKIDQNSFLLLMHDRKNLIVGDVLTSTTNPWTLGGRLDFKIFRNGRRIFEGKRSIYQTGIIEKMEILKSPLIYTLYQ